jgi:hypothetical protein
MAAFFIKSCTNNIDLHAQSVTVANRTEMIYGNYFFPEY